MFLNMKLLAQHTLNGFGGMGEGMSMQLARDGRRVLWLAHESAPKNVTAVDVTDPRKPSVILQTDLPHGDMRSNSLDLAGDLLVVAYQTRTVGLKPAGFGARHASEHRMIGPLGVERPRVAADARIARGAQHLGRPRGAEQRPDDRVLATAGADDQDPHTAPMKSSIGIAESDS